MRSLKSPVRSTRYSAGAGFKRSFPPTREVSRNRLQEFVSFSFFFNNHGPSSIVKFVREFGSVAAFRTEARARSDVRKARRARRRVRDARRSRLIKPIKPRARAPSMCNTRPLSCVPIDVFPGGEGGGKGVFLSLRTHGSRPACALDVLAISVAVSEKTRYTRR